jgi:hypothetical protein
VNDIPFLLTVHFCNSLPPSLLYFVANLSRGTNMTTLQDNAVGPASQNELISPARLLLLAPSEPRAPIAILSPAKRNALVACFNAGGLHKKDGAWHGPPGGKPVSGMTTADLARDGMLTVTTNHRFGSAQLTERGNWFARTLLCQGPTANSESVRFGSCSPVPTR